MYIFQYHCFCLICTLFHRWVLITLEVLKFNMYLSIMYISTQKLLKYIFKYIKKSLVWLLVRLFYILGHFLSSRPATKSKYWIRLFKHYICMENTFFKTAAYYTSIYIKALVKKMMTIHTNTQWSFHSCSGKGYVKFPDKTRKKNPLIMVVNSIPRMIFLSLFRDIIVVCFL